jgi:hypothetical protein
VLEIPRLENNVIEPILTDTIVPDPEDVLE